MTPKRPRDPNQLAKSIIDIATGQKPDRDPTPEEQGKDPAAVALGRKGGLKGGKARATRMTPEQRSESARKAAQAQRKFSEDMARLERQSLVSDLEGAVKKDALKDFDGVFFLAERGGDRIQANGAA